MKLTVRERIEQGTPKGAMLFSPDNEYEVTKRGAEFEVNHDPVALYKSVGGKRVRTLVRKTLVSQAVLDKLTSAPEVSYEG